MLVLKQFPLREEWMKTVTVPTESMASWVGHWEIYDADPSHGGSIIGAGVGPEFSREQTALNAAASAGIDWLLGRERQMLIDQYFAEI
ncbi:hypothetical protein [Burkholderia vietnamiensis]|uniref:hypothetical protein n=1 Tax=Burkholderia vietnamiensis TaxID=60552 RepID=UPI00075C1A63|nr:hypothetical protein [Burkholderia vietnamiensis]KVF72345.1 hypothetical protein WJ17_03695 [Burkholderia vietnamiensis]MCO1349218.1 hypothetical protein [Burkholderia vietnamiensis]MCO1431690.1 hypothetical protein [Burkholderia vietnamiensis]MDN7409483.1 hypothetical protein [Burkholderia vietnamiensis]UQN45326.1 hypothetical protein L0Y95_07650 [Burkholderia vietnamiensis]